MDTRRQRHLAAGTRDRETPARGRKYSDGAGDEAQYLPGHSIGRLTTFLTGIQLVGDDEQYAAIFALMTNFLGVPARVVLAPSPSRVVSSRARTSTPGSRCTRPTAAGCGSDQRVHAGHVQEAGQDSAATAAEQLGRGGAAAQFGAPAELARQPGSAADSG